MVNLDFVRLFVLLLLPFVLRKGADWLRRRRRLATRAERSETHADKAVLVLLVIHILYQLYYIFLSPPPNVFRRLGVSLRASHAFLMQMMSRRGQPLSTRDGALLVRLQSFEGRLLYATYGEHALVDCTYCVEPTDYLYFVLPSSAAAYIPMACVLGAATILRRKAHWRTYGVIFMAGCGFAECFALATADPRQMTTGHDTYHLNASIDFYRRLAFVALSIGVMTLNQMDERSDVEILTEVARQQEEIVRHINASNMQRTVTLRNSNLRQIFVEHYRRVESEHGYVADDPEFQRAKAKALSKFDVEKLEREAVAYVENITRMRENSSSGDYDFLPGSYTSKTQ